MLGACSGLFKTIRVRVTGALTVSQDIEQDSARLLSSGVFRAARPLVFPPRGSTETYPQVQQLSEDSPRTCSETNPQVHLA